MIRLQQIDGRMSNVAIAQKLAISEYTVRTCMNRLLETETLKIVVVANPIDLGFEIVGNLKIKSELN